MKTAPPKSEGERLGRFRQFTKGSRKKTLLRQASWLRDGSEMPRDRKFRTKEGRGKRRGYRRADHGGVKVIGHTVGGIRELKEQEKGTRQVPWGRDSHGWRGRVGEKKMVGNRNLELPNGALGQPEIRHSREKGRNFSCGQK